MLQTPRSGFKRAPASEQRRRSIGADGDTPPDVGSNLRRLRHQQGYSLETLAKISGVSRAMLGQIETGKSVPTITLIWKVAKALGIPAIVLITNPKNTHATVISVGTAPITSASNGQYRSQIFALAGSAQPFDFSEIAIAPRHRETFEACAIASRGTLLVTSGSMEIAAAGEPVVRASVGDAILFRTDCEHSYFNPNAEEAKAYLVIAPARNIGI